MASRKEYGYQVIGKKFRLVEKDFNGADSGLNYTYTDGGGLDLPSGFGTYKSPGSSVSEGIELEYTTSRSSEVIDESSTINLPSYLTQALVYYVKGKLQEDLGQIEMKEYFMKEFRKILEKHESSKVAGPRMIMSGKNAIR